MRNFKPQINNPYPNSYSYILLIKQESAMSVWDFVFTILKYYLNPTKLIFGLIKNLITETYKFRNSVDLWTSQIYFLFQSWSRVRVEFKDEIKQLKRQVRDYELKVMQKRIHVANAEELINEARSLTKQIMKSQIYIHI